MTIANKTTSTDTGAAKHVMQQHLLDSDLFDDFDILDIDEGFDADVNELMGASHGLDADDFH